jgi:acetyl-CoA synthetase
VAWVVPTATPPRIEELKELVARTVAAWAAPKEVEFVASLPRSASGKVRRADLR